MIKYESTRGSQNYKTAAQAGDADGAYKAGWCWENHYGVSDPAIEWYKAAAELGNEQAAQALDRMTRDQNGSLPEP